MTDSLRVFCMHHSVAPGGGGIDSRTLRVYRLGTDGRFNHEDDFVAEYDRVIDRETLALDHGPGSYVIELIENDVAIDSTLGTLSAKYCEEARDKNPHIVAQKQRDDEAWMHAACLSIAEGCLNWNESTPLDSLAMIKVRDLRRRYEEAYSSLKALGNIQADLERKAYARGILAVKDILAKQSIALSPEASEALELAAESATPFDSADPEIERLEGLIGDVHDLLWSSEHRKESIYDMAKRVKNERDELRKQNEKMVARFLQTDPSLEEVEREKVTRGRLETALKAIADDTDEYRTWVRVMRATQPDASSWPIPKRLVGQMPVSCNRMFAARGSVAHCDLPDGHSGTCREHR